MIEGPLEYDRAGVATDRLGSVAASSVDHIHRRAPFDGRGNSHSKIAFLVLSEEDDREVIKVICR